MFVPLYKILLLYLLLNLHTLVACAKCLRSDTADAAVAIPPAGLVLVVPLLVLLLLPLLLLLLLTC